jgi:hypothetical protein
VFAPDRYVRAAVENRGTFVRWEFVAAVQPHPSMLELLWYHPSYLAIEILKTYCLGVRFVLGAVARRTVDLKSFSTDRQRFLLADCQI